MVVVRKSENRKRERDIYVPGYLDILGEYVNSLFYDIQKGFTDRMNALARDEKST